MTLSLSAPSMSSSISTRAGSGRRIVTSPSAGIAAGQASKLACETASDLASPAGSSKRPSSSVRTGRLVVLAAIARPGRAARFRPVGPMAKTAASFTGLPA